MNECKGCLIRSKKIEVLEKEIGLLKRKLKHFTTTSKSAKGRRAELWILSQIRGGALTENGAASDICLRNGKKIEVKYSSLTTPVKHSKTRRWNWDRVLGNSRKKDWNYLILVGEKDDIHYRYEEDNSPFVYFLFNKRTIKSVITPGNPSGHIALTLNPKSSERSKRILKYRMTAKEIEKFLKQLSKSK